MEELRQEVAFHRTLLMCTPVALSLIAADASIRYSSPGVISVSLHRTSQSSTGVRAGGDDLIESALARARHPFLYVADADLASVAAAYLVGLTMNHGYVDGNKRVGFACAATFLRLNGVRLTAPEVEAYEIVIGLTEGRITEEQIATWIRANVTKTSG